MTVSVRAQEVVGTHSPRKMSTFSVCWGWHLLSTLVLFLLKVKQKSLLLTTVRFIESLGTGGDNPLTLCGAISLEHPRSYQQNWRLYLLNFLFISSAGSGQV